MRWVVIVVVVIAAVFALSVVLSPKDTAAPAPGNTSGQGATPTGIVGPSLAATSTGIKLAAASATLVRAEISARVRNTDPRAVRLERIRYDVYYWDEPSFWIYFGSTDAPVNVQVQSGADTAVPITVDTHSADTAAKVYELLSRGPVLLRANGAVQGAAGGQVGQTVVPGLDMKVTLPK